jgi:hypothetical protein
MTQELDLSKENKKKNQLKGKHDDSGLIHPDLAVDDLALYLMPSETDSMALDPEVFQAAIEATKLKGQRVTKATAKALEEQKSRVSDKPASPLLPDQSDEDEYTQSV